MCINQIKFNNLNQTKMKTKFQMLKQLLQNGVTKEQIKSKRFEGVDFKIDFKDWNFYLFNFSSADFSFANFRYADFSSADFSSAYFRYANFSSADFSSADFRYANFSSADFSFADFRYANFSSADFSSADFRYANFSSADFRYANFSSADFRYANFSSADFSITINECTVGLTLACPEEGSFIAYKKCKNDIIVKLQITENAKRSSATTLKCRASEALVIDIEGGLTQVESKYDKSFLYIKGQIVKVKDFDEDRWNECSTGIHFFMSKELAKQY